MKKNISDTAVFYDLEWDTKYFGVKSAKAILYKPLLPLQWSELKLLFCGYQFVSIENRNSEPVNAQLIGKDSNAFLADVNIQFSKKIYSHNDNIHNVTLHETLKQNEQILQLTDFQYSKFTEDPELLKRGGDQVYYQWVLNSFEKLNKSFSISRDGKGNINGFLLHSYSENYCTVELIAVSRDVQLCGVGTSLFQSVENSALTKGCRRIKVGTQVRNIGAINFYHKMKYMQVGCHQIYHLWGL